MASEQGVFQRELVIDFSQSQIGAEIVSPLVDISLKISAVSDEFCFVKIVVRKQQYKGEYLKRQKDQENIEPLYKCEDIPHAKSGNELQRRNLCMRDYSRMRN